MGWVVSQMRSFLKTVQMAYFGQTNEGYVYLFPRIMVKLLYVIPLLFLWKIISSQGAQLELTLPQLLSYTYMQTLLTDLLVVQTEASSWNYEGKLIGFFTRPFGVLRQLIAQTMGTWFPMLIFFSLPMFFLAPLFGISLVAQSSWFWFSLLLCISLGFAIDFIFVCITIHLRGMAWLGYVIRLSVAALFSGSVIPFQVMPVFLIRFFQVQPFGSLAGAPLSLFIGQGNPFMIIGLQLFWNFMLWPLAIGWFRKSQEKMVSYGG